MSDKLLLQAASLGITERVRILLDHGACVNCADTWGYTALMCAVERQHDACILLLLEYGADIAAVNRNGDSALSLAAHQGLVSYIQLFLETVKIRRDVHRDLRDREVLGNMNTAAWKMLLLVSRALHIATIHGHAPCVSILQSYYY